MDSRYVGRNSPQQTLRLPDGNTRSLRTIFKIRSGETGMASVVDQIVRVGAPMPGSSRSADAWLDEVIFGSSLSRRWYPVNHINVFAVTRPSRLVVRQVPLPPHPLLDRAAP